MAKKSSNVEELGADSVQMKLTELELARLQLHRVRVQMQTGSIETLQLKDNLLMIDYQNKRAVLKGSIKDATDSRDSAMRDYNMQIAEIEARLGIKMDECVVDDITGVVRRESEIQ